MSLMTSPQFSVIMATYGRGSHVRPSIQSVLNQDFDDFELIVVGDNCHDETEAFVSSLGHPKVKWINLTERCGSQSAPNNAGIEASSAKYIAYLGHDDIWAPNHLSELDKLFAGDSDLDFAVGGAVFHMPEGVKGDQVTGIFEDDSAKHVHFFPPSSFAHRRDVCERIGIWKMPELSRAPVDNDILIRAAKADMKFASTRQVTVHKFAAGHRYLSYVRQESDEQARMLARVGRSDHCTYAEQLVRASKLAGTYMAVCHENFEKYRPGELAQANGARKGLRIEAVELPARGVTLRQKVTPCALDWRDKPRRGIRWHTLNPNPKILVPFTNRDDAQLTLQVFHKDRAAISELEFRCNGQDFLVKSENIRRGYKKWRAEISARISLDANEATVLELALRPVQVARKLSRGLGIGQLELQACADTTK